VIEPDNRAARRFRDMLLLTSAVPAARHDGHADPAKAFRIKLPVIATSPDICPPAGDDAECRAFSHIAGDRTVGLDHRCRCRHRRSARADRPFGNSCGMMLPWTTEIVHLR